MNKTIIFHMGAHKTGTTILQSTLLKNNEVLSKYGVEYLDMQDGMSNHVINFMPIVDRELKSWIFNKDISGGYYISNDKAPEFKVWLLKRFLVEYDRFLANENIHTLIISAEGFEYWEREDFEYTKEILQNNAHDVAIEIKPIIYIREINSYLSSQIQETEKATKYTTLNSKNSDFLDKWYQYDRLLSAVEDVFGRENVMVLKYDKSILYKSSIIDDFLLNVLNIQVNEEFEVSNNTNESLGMNETILRSVYSEKYDKNMMTLSRLPNYNDIKKVDQIKFKIDFEFCASDADIVNKSIIKVNEYLDEDKKFHLVKASENETIYPTIENIDVNYLKKLKLFIENTLVDYDEDLYKIDKNAIKLFNNELQEIIDTRLALLSRVVIYFFYDKDGIVNDYVYQFLDGLKYNMSRLVIVVNGKLTKEGRAGFERYTNDLIVRENEGLDVWAYKTGIEYLGWDYLAEIKELVLINSTLYGPIYPFEEMFNEMDSRDIDFWGITKHHRTDETYHKSKYGYIPEHIQSSFIAVRNKMLNSIEYKKLWEDMPEINGYSDSVSKYESIFTKDFEDKGYISDVYINTEDLREFTRYPLLLMSDELIINRKCPVMKRKSFGEPFNTFRQSTVGIQTLKTFNYIKENTDYNTDLIMDDIIRCINLNDIKSTMHLDFTLPLKHKLAEINKERKIALCIHMYFTDLIEYCYDYVKNMPVGSDIFITSDSDEKLEAIKEVFDKLADRFGKIEYIKIENRGRDVSALLVGFKKYVNDYDYVCFAHDKKTAQVKPYSVGLGFSEKCFDNTLGSEEYIANVINLFESDKYLGVLSPHYPIHAQYESIIGYEWTGNYENTYKLLVEDMKLNVNLAPNKPPVAPLGTMFWFRPEALKVLFDQDWEYEDFPPEPNDYNGTILHAIERAYGIIPQHEGYYSAFVLNDEMRRVTVTDMYTLALHYKTMMYNNTMHFDGVLTKREKARNTIKSIMPPIVFKAAVDTKRFLIGPRDLKGNY